MPTHHRTPIGPSDRIHVQGRYLFRENGERFFVRGMGFPIPPPPVGPTTRPDYYYVNTTGWKAVLDQLAATDDALNTVRLYQANCTRPDDYDDFLRHAAQLGIYVIWPLTTATGDGVLARTASCQRPKHRRHLQSYGKACWENIVARHPNILAGTVGNEVMNTLVAWQAAAPCVKAYAQDLAQIMANDDSHSIINHTSTPPYRLPLLYAAQHDSPTADILPDEAMAWTLNYLACREDDDQDDDDDATNDLNLIFGVNIESWCSSLQTFEYEEDGISESSYHALWRTLQQPDVAYVPVIFSEMGCSRALFNRDNGLREGEESTLANNGGGGGTLIAPRDWQQIPVVLHEMANVWSGFVAYAYDGGGNPLFRIMGGGTSLWNGRDVLPADTADYANFRHQLQRAVATMNDDATSFLAAPNNTTSGRPSCTTVRNEIAKAWHVKLVRLPALSSPAQRLTFYVVHHWLLLLLLLLVGVGWCWRWRRGKAKPEKGAGPTEQDPLLS